ncbi:MAG: polysaccharide deacetylase family protein [Planctomycetota bacterium]|jgi:peptidoglycan/xylan/chitin deacetylase (PgdA/CDA1 family)|nr:polysaccharide deacetylase family protein [Planctomycetota bacterium]
MARICHVLSQTHLTGAEVCAARLAAEQMQAGHHCLLVSDAIHVTTEAVVETLPVHRARGAQRRRSIAQLCELCQREGIDILHSHSRAAAHLANAVARRLQLPHLAQIHGRQGVHWHSRFKPHPYGRALSAMCCNVRRHLIADLAIAPGRIRVIPNPIDPPSACEPALPPSTLRRIVWIGRLTGPKGEIARRLAYTIAPGLSDCELIIVGGPERPAEWGAPPSSVRMVGQQADIAPWLACADLVIGGGRVCFEAALAGKPVLALGEANAPGLLNADTINAALASNGGDVAPPDGIDWDQVDTDLAVTAPAAFTGSQLSAFAPAAVAAATERGYDHARIAAATAGLREIPALLYHRVLPTAPSDSRFNVYVTSEQMRAHLSLLRARGCTFVTAADLLRGTPLRRPVWLTFDDGYRDNYEHLLPLLQEFNAKATVFALGDRSIDHNAWDAANGEPAAPLMSGEQLRACHDSGHIEIASHGMGHRKLCQLDDQALEHELAASKASLENLIGAAVPAFAYPWGEYQQRERDAVQAAGYALGIGTVNGPLHPADDPYRIRRITMFPRDHGTSFAKKASGWYLRLCRARGKDGPFQ